MKNQNSFTAPKYRVEMDTARLIGVFESESEAKKCADKSYRRVILKHNRPANGCEGNYSFYYRSQSL